jgi:hypothetical protein
MTGFRDGRRRLGALSLVLVAALLLSAGCGKPAYTYVKNSNVKTYFKVPAEWTPTDTESDDYRFAQILFAAENRDSQAYMDFRHLRWSVEYNSPFDEKDQTDGPITYGLVTPVPTWAQGVISLDAMRNLIAPVTAAAQAQAAAKQQLPPAFEVLDDEVLTPEPGMRGVRVVYNAANDEVHLYTYDFTMMTNNDSTVVYILYLWCPTKYYRQNMVKINDVVTSFTVRNAS